MTHFYSIDTTTNTQQETLTPPNILINCRALQILVNYEKPETIVQTLIELTNYAATGIMPKKPSYAFLTLFTEVKKGREKYLRTCEYNRMLAAQRKERRQNVKAAGQGTAQQGKAQQPINGGAEGTDLTKLAQAYGFPNTKGDAYTLKKLIQEYGHTATLQAIIIAGQGSPQKRNWHYVRGILENKRNNTPKPTPNTYHGSHNTATAQHRNTYEERTYTDEELEAAAGTRELLKEAARQQA